MLNFLKCLRKMGVGWCTRESNWSEERGPHPQQLMAETTVQCSSSCGGPRVRIWFARIPHLSFPSTATGPTLCPPLPPKPSQLPRWANGSKIWFRIKIEIRSDAPEEFAVFSRKISELRNIFSNYLEEKIKISNGGAV